MTASLDVHATKRTNRNIFFGKHENKSEWTAEKRPVKENCNDSKRIGGDDGTVSDESIQLSLSPARTHVRCDYL